MAFTGINTQGRQEPPPCLPQVPDRGASHLLPEPSIIELAAAPMGHRLLVVMPQQGALPK